jgi:serine/threonine-protein kinase
MAQRDKYRVIRKIDAGGMAEVFQGVAEGLRGFAKKVAIKRVLPHLAQNAKFLAMFLDEARLSLRMNHANVVQVFDIGRSGGTYFIVMEFVDGTDLKKIMERMRERRARLPTAQAIYIMTEVCKGLSYAHDLTDIDGHNLGIVHRDVSPPNVLISKQGEVKIVDFGLAKATSQLEHTDPGVVKGKFAYLSPESAWGKEVDSRADVFACGIILFELLTGRRLFLGESDVDTVELVRRAQVPQMQPDNPEIKPALEQIVRRSLAPDPRKRYQRCDEMAEDLASYLFEHGMKVTGFDLRRMVTTIAAEEEDEERARPSIIDQLIQEEMGRFSSLDDDDGISPADGRLAPEATGAQPLNPAGFEDPRGWVGELQVGGSDTPLPADNKGGWVESGLHRRDSAISEVEVPPQTGADSQGPASLAQMLEGEMRSASEAPAPSGRGAAVGIAIAVAIALLAAGGAAAYFLGWIP